MTAQRELGARDVARQVEASSEMLLAAHDAHVRQATASVDWERRGLLGRLVRVERVPERIDGHVERDSRPEERRVA
jgi:hypothetical protein